MRPWIASLLVFFIGAVLLPNPALAAQDCAADKLAVIRSAPVAGDGAVLIDCHLKLSPGEVITRSLYFNRGSVSNGVVVDCDGATLSHTEVNADIPRINVQSMNSVNDEGLAVWDRPQDIAIRNCILHGSINVTGMGGQHVAAVVESSRTDARHTQVLRDRAPTNIVFDNLTIDPGGRIAVYLSMGVTGVTIQNSLFQGSSFSVAIYLDAESGFNRILNNRFAIDTAREVIAIDGSSENLVQGNAFELGALGGIFIYRNCGEAGAVRHNPPVKNDLFDNRFLDPGDAALPIPHVAVASRNGNRSYCEADAGYPYGSSIDNRDHAHFTAIKGNHFDGARPALHLAEGPKLVIDNTAAVEGAIPAADGFGGTFVNNRAGTAPEPSTSCFFRAETPMLLRDQETFDLSLADPQAVGCAAQRLACDAGQLVAQPNACNAGRIVLHHFKCAIKNSDAGCTKPLSCGSRKKLQAVRARCNLESAAGNPAALVGMAWNTLAVDRVSDVLADGHCMVGGYDIATGATDLLGFLASPATARCREFDADGGDCRIEGDYVCY